MHLITTFIDLSQGILFVESPRCKRKLRINLKSDSYCGGKEAMDLQAQRCDIKYFSLTPHSNCYFLLGMKPSKSIGPLWTGKFFSMTEMASLFFHHPSQKTRIRH